MLALLAVAALGGCSDSAGRPVPSLVENLSFTGTVTGRLSSGVDATTPISTDPQPTPSITEDGMVVEPAPAATQCATVAVSGFPPDFVAVIRGSAGTTPVALSVEVHQDAAAYRTPGAPLLPGDTNDGGSVALAETTGPRRWQQVAGPDGQPPAQIVLYPDRHSGHLDAWLGDRAMSQKATPADVRVVGDWRCA